MVGGGLFAAAAPASATPCAAGPPACMRIDGANPAIGIVHGQIVSVSAQQLATEGYPAGTELVVVECNANLATMDANACDQNPTDLNKPGGPAIAVEGAAQGGKILISYPVRVSATNPVGDGLCTPGGTTGSPTGTCFLVLADIATEAVVAEAAFVTQ